jgi:hypothetical protein
MMGCDQLSHAARTAVDHQPEAVLLIGLKFDKVVPAAECSELNPAVTGALSFEPFVAEGQLTQRLRLIGRGGYRSVPLHGNASMKFGEERPRMSLVIQDITSGIEPHGQHPATDVAANERWIDQLPRGHGQTDTDGFRAVHVGHDGDVSDIFCGLNPFDRLPDLRPDLLRQPFVQCRR